MAHAAGPKLTKRQLAVIERLTRKQLPAEVWRIDREPGTNSVTVHVARVSGKLDHFGLGCMLATHPQCGYFLDAPPGPSMFRFLSVTSASNRIA